MKKLSICFQSFFFSLATLLYVAGVALILNNGEKIFGEMKSFIGPVAFLLLFVFSALTVGGLILGRPVYLILNKENKEGLKLFFLNAGWVLLFLLILFTIMIVTR